MQNITNNMLQKTNNLVTSIFKNNFSDKLSKKNSVSKVLNCYISWIIVFRFQFLVVSLLLLMTILRRQKIREKFNALFKEKS